MTTHGLRAMLVAGIVTLLLLAVAASPRVAVNAGGGPPGGQGVSFRLEPERPTEVDEIVVVALITDDWCYSIDGVELGVSEDAIDIRVVADEGELCPAVVGPFEVELPVPIGRLSAGRYTVDVSFSLCGFASCSEIGIEGSFDVVPVGDANCDGAVNAIDAALVLQYGAGLLQSLLCQGAADANGDGSVNAIDSALILQYVAGLLGQLPPG